MKQQQVDLTIVNLSIQHPEFGSHKVGRLVRNRGQWVSSEWVRQVRREESLQVSQTAIGLVLAGSSPGKIRSGGQKPQV